jgi:hypothetical protein
VTARPGAPPGRRSRPITQPAGSNVVEVTTTDQTTVAHPAHKADKASCWLCPLPHCGWAACRVDVEQVAS